MENTTPNADQVEDIFTNPSNDLAPAPNATSSGSRIHFPPPLDVSSRPSRQYPEYLQKSYGMNFTPPVRRGSPLNPQKSNQRRSLHGNGSPLDSPPRHRRIPSPGIVDMTSSSLEQEPDFGVFSNEYDLSHEDPRILLDVQRALKLKARREARLKREQSASPQQNASPQAIPSTPSSAPGSVQSTWKTRGTILPSPPISPTPPRKASNSTTSDIDFSPSTGLLHLPVYAHPVPTSVDNGKTLDWTTSFSEDDKLDKRWSLSIGKKKEKDRILPLSTVAEQQDVSYKDKLEKIRTIAAPQTLRKVAITKEQLDRRYKLIYDSISPDRPIQTFNLLRVARWYASVDDLVKRTIEKAEPFSWLKHLERPGHKEKRLPWHLSALVMEEYIQASNLAPTMLEDPLSFETKHNYRAMLAFSGSVGGEADAASPAQEIISFEPRRESLEDATDRWSRNARESAISITFSSTSTSGLTPELKTSVPRPYPQNKAKSDVSSIAESSTDFSDSGIVKKFALVDPSRKTAQSMPMGSEIQAALSHEPQEQGESTVVPVQNKLSSSSNASEGGQQHPKPPGVQSRPSLKRNPLPRRIRMSDPSNDGPKRYAIEEDELLIRREYESKLRLLDEASAYNHRIRQMLNRISASIREYDAIQSASSKTPGISRRPLPKDLVDAFSHDPAAVTGATRRLRGWRAVEDIHQRLIRQRQVFQAFLSKPPIPPAQLESILDGPINHLMETLDTLESHQNTIVGTTTELTQLLQKVQRVHAEGKQEYNITISRTSVLYPELSHIIALEESYRDRYQKFWDFGMDALTLLLDTVTPFWRNYGKIIGEDVRDFLIIPLYRNEFTGEPKRYRIKGVPHRTIQHWLGLVVFFVASIMVNFLQLRAAITTSGHCRLQWIPYDGVRWTALPLFWIAILVQWIAVLVEFAIVVMQLGVIIWWTGWLINIFH